jgi:hypothetical protein
VCLLLFLIHFGNFWIAFCVSWLHRNFIGEFDFTSCILNVIHTIFGTQNL